MSEPRDYKVVVVTADGGVQTVWATASESAFYDELPFTQSNVLSTTITIPGR